MIRTGLELDEGGVEGVRVLPSDVMNDQARDAALLRALLDAARIRGVVVLLRDGTCAIGSEMPEHHEDLRTAVVLACERLGLDPEPRSIRETLPDIGGQGSNEEGGDG